MKFGISVVVVTFNSSAVIRSCLDGLVVNEHLLEIIVVDNASKDDTVDIVRREFPSVLIRQNSSNVGFAAAVNEGARYGSKDFIALLNPDAVINAAALHELVKIQRSHPGPSIVAPRIVHPTGRLRIVSAGRFPTPWRMFCHYFGISRISASHVFEGHYLLENRLVPVQSVDWVTGAMLLAKREDWTALNGLSERWFMYAEDIEFCWRAKQNNIEVLLARDVTATHLVGASSSEVQPVNAAWVVNLYDFYCDSMAGTVLGQICWKAIVAAGLLSRSVIYLIESAISRNSRDRRAWKSESVRFCSFAVQLLRTR